MVQGLAHAQIRIAQLHVLAHQPHAHRLLGAANLFDDLAPAIKLGRLCPVKSESLDQVVTQACLLQDQRHLIDDGRGDQRDHRTLFHVTEEGDLGPYVLVYRLIGARDNDVRLNTDPAQLADTVLGGLGL